MGFLHLFNLTDFDEAGKVCATTKVDINHSRSNFLYLICKYNQAFLKEENLKVPEFFKEKLSSVLFEVENGGDFEGAKKLIYKNCVPKVQNFLEKAKNEKECIVFLNENVSVKDKMFAAKFEKTINNLQLTYILTVISGKILEDVSRQSLNPSVFEDKESKSKIFKDVIKYNSLVSAADKVKENKLSSQDFLKMVGWVGLKAYIKKFL